MRKGDFDEFSPSEFESDKFNWCQFIRYTELLVDLIKWPLSICDFT